MTEAQLIREINRLVKSDTDSLQEIDAIAGLLDTAIDEQPLEVVSDYGIHHQMNHALWETIDNREYMSVENILVTNPCDTWEDPDRLKVYRPSSLKGLVEAVLDAESLGLRIKGLASGHSFSNAPRTKGAYIYLSGGRMVDSVMTNCNPPLIQDSLTLLIDNLDPSIVKSDLLDVAGGLTISKLNDLLCPFNTPLTDASKKRRLLNMGGGDVQTFAGAFSTGTHGTGGKFSAYHDMVRSILVVCSGGRAFRIEPASKPITDKTKHDSYYAAHAEKPKVELLFSDDLFYSLLVSFGCFGIIYSAIIETTQMDVMHEELVYTSAGFDDKLQKKFKSDMLKPFTDNRHDSFYNILVNPYKLKGKKYHSILEKTIEVTTSTKPRRKEGGRNFWPTFLTGNRLTAEIMRSIATGPGNKKKLIEGILKNLNDNKNTPGKGYTDLSYRLWHSGGGETKSMGMGIEFAFKTSRIPAVLEKVFDLLQKRLEPGIIGKPKRFLNSPLSLRFVRPSKAYLAPNYEKDITDTPVSEWCYIELLRINNKRKKDNQAELSIYADLQNLLKDEGGRVHWGLNINFPFDKPYLRAHYKKLDAWIAAYKFFNANGTFDNAFTQQCGFRA